MYLDVGFEGYFACRLATDPDPTNEERGMSGFTMALPSEDPLDQGLRLQVDDDYHKNLRPPLKDKGMGIEIGVNVTSVTHKGKPWHQPGGLIGAKVSLKGHDDPEAGLSLPIFESRNNIVGSDDTRAFVINPFDLEIRNDTHCLTAYDDINPNSEHKRLWEIFNPNVYKRRLTYCWNLNDPQVSQAINVYDPYAYFRSRRLFLQQCIAENEARINSSGAGVDAERLQEENQGYKTRIYQLEFWGERFIKTLLIRAEWQFAINGAKTYGFDLGVTIDEKGDWPITFWFGGWDSDLLIGYMRGTLSLPYEKQGV
ncbi:MAG: hypothetical protein ETSY2_05090 [Candidatus Entotheonella gemina]|uniref:Uncharacterized protein n=1 Tax=Candidatus Entotheonella gemina TaxID=1429439 RepID=W4ME49_9BACT|nr:MAG: hypothetical protein ETSY2_05090 [Candidatus Entotheonella gemina]